MIDSVELLWFLADLTDDDFAALRDDLRAAGMSIDLAVAVLAALVGPGADP